MKTHILKLHCPDAVGLLARITGFIAGSGGNLLEVSQYTDPLSKWFFSGLLSLGEKLIPIHRSSARSSSPSRRQWGRIGLCALVIDR